MPGRDGLQLAAELLAIRPDVEVAFISANQQREIVGRARALNAEFLPKSLVPEALRAFLDERSCANVDLAARRRVQETVAVISGVYLPMTRVIISCHGTFAVRRTFCQQVCRI